MDVRNNIIEKDMYRHNTLYQTIPYQTKHPDMRTDATVSTDTKNAMSD